MKKFVFAAALSGAIFAQDGPPRQFRSPIMAALDTDGDGVISAAELAKAPEALKALDKNGDGKITMDEVRPNFGPGGPGMPGGGPGGPRGQDMVARMMEFDKNGDGKLTKDELPERMQAMIERGDTNKDGALDKAELEKMVEQQRGAGGPGGPGGFGGPGGMRRDPIFAALDTDGDGELSAIEIGNAAVALKSLDKNGDGKLSMEELRPNFGPRGMDRPGGRPRDRNQ